MSDCPRVGKWIGGCKFRPRYDEQQATDAIMWMMTGTRGQLMPRPAKKTYLCDVCERCGKTLFRRKAAAS
jgi:hypothetical protein